MAANGQLRIAFLRVDGVGIAMQLIIAHASVWVYKWATTNNGRSIPLACSSCGT